MRSNLSILGVLNKQTLRSFHVDISQDRESSLVDLHYNFMSEKSCTPSSAEGQTEIQGMMTSSESQAIDLSLKKMAKTAQQRCYEVGHKLPSSFWLKIVWVGGGSHTLFWHHIWYLQGIFRGILPLVWNLHQILFSHSRDIATYRQAEKLYGKNKFREFLSLMT